MILKYWIVLLFTNLCYVLALSDKSYVRLIKCGEGLFDPNHYTCFGTLACPILDGVAYLRCGEACYSPKLYHCVSGVLHQGPEPPEKQTPQRTTTPYYPPNKITPQPTPTTSRHPTFTVPPPSPKPSAKGKPGKGDASSNVMSFSVFSIVSIAFLILVL
ncbi:uncharacterized protein T551_00612 [Pneumocystis jirovecii RU7]|uniref:Endo-1,3(4)-beta-glucanase 1 carbohydrate binding domain-containing protein n=1 Tax=Pneumocystis jirovecii (strain RU7) TaxID=1408657 RepID=A0A0W4ZU81_PNEJ7|nr:uncharacterized protein T551_00612 [Pneumocystis jirovecii RU7]KTW31929.1 hypothetical protein T551_00612 [Pneumocystis jirovecii RU7]